MKVSICKDVFASESNVPSSESQCLSVCLCISQKFQAAEISVCKSLFIYFWCLSVCLCISQKFQAAKVSICNDVFALVKGFKQRKSVFVTMSLH